MKAVSLNEIKQELQHLSAKDITELCLRLARYKKENKELLAFLLFNAHDIEGYTNELKTDIEEGFTEVNKINLYLAKKTLRKILRQINKQVRFTLNKQMEAVSCFNLFNQQFIFFRNMRKLCLQIEQWF